MGARLSLRDTRISQELSCRAKIKIMTKQMTAGPSQCKYAYLCPLPQFFLYFNLEVMSVAQRLTGMLVHYSQHSCVYSNTSLPSPQLLFALCVCGKWPDLEPTLRLFWFIVQRLQNHIYLYSKGDDAPYGQHSTTKRPLQLYN